MEIGPGLGTLTEVLADRAHLVAAVEVDPGMRRVLAETLADRANVVVVDADILRVDPHRLVSDAAGVAAADTFKVVANLPYNITSAALRHVLEAQTKPSLAVVMVQREVAERITAMPGALSILGVSVQFYARPTYIATVPAAAFYPRPKVDSAIVRLDVPTEPPVSVPDAGPFFRVVRAGFGQKRKQLRNSLASGLAVAPATAAAVLTTAGIDPARRAETLSLGEWASLTTAVLDLDTRS